MKEDRIAMYRFLSIGFTYPEERFEEVIDKAIQLFHKSYTNLNKNDYKITGIRNLKKGLEEIKGMTLHEWQGIYTGLFISNFPKTPFHPYESFYKEGLVGGNVSDEVKEIYESCGLEVFDEREFADYLVFELEFSAFLLENEEGCKPIIKDFFENHLLSWAPSFFEDVKGGSDVPLFYKSLGEMGYSFLTKEKKLIQELSNEG